MNKKTIILASVSGVIILLIIILSIANSTIKNNASILTDSKTFFKINAAINESISKDNNAEAFLATQMYYKETGLITTYFAKGFYLKGVVDLNYEDNVYYLVKVKGVSYELSKVNISDLKEYADNYEEDAKDINNELLMPTYVYNEKNKLFYYLSVFSNLLNYNPREAYNYLTEDEKSEFNSFDNFNNNIQNIKNNISVNVEDYTTQKSAKETIYTINTGGKSQVTIYENGVMNIKIDF